MNARGVLAFMATMLLLGGIVQAAPYNGIYFHENFNYEDQASFDAAWPCVFTAKTTVTPTIAPQTAQLRLGDGVPADPQSLINQEFNGAIGGVPTVAGNRRSYHVLPSTYTDLSTFKATPGRDMVIDFWFKDVYNPALGTANTKQAIEFRGYGQASPSATGFPITAQNAGATAPPGYNWILAFGTDNSNFYKFRNVGYGVSAWTISSLARTAGWHHFKIEVIAPTASTGQLKFWDITSTPNNFANLALPTVTGAGLALNVVMFGGGNPSTNGEGYLDELRITPEPMSLALLGLGSLLLRRRRA